jgi:hypothetical protein
VHIIEKEKEVTAEIRDKYEHIKDVDAVIRYLSKRELVRNDGDCSISGSEAFDIVKNAMVEYEQKQVHLNGLKRKLPW